ncbi:MAG TPA: hypothetical protein VK488_04035 [Gaiellaceae bacterium]|nr:hypothetical protein [Gaiellaceae bacterium]
MDPASRSTLCVSSNHELFTTRFGMSGQAAKKSATALGLLARDPSTELLAVAN